MDILQALGADSEFVKFINLGGLPTALFVVLSALILLRFVTRFLDGLGERLTERRLLLKQIAVVVRFVVLVGATLMAGGALFEVSGQALYGVVGILIFALGYATKDVLSSVTAGFILMFDRPFQVGDRITFSGHYGEVVEIGLRTVRLVDLEDNLVSIPNARFLSDTVACANAGALDQMCVFPFYIGCSEDIDTAKRIVYEATASSRYVYLGKPITIEVREGPIPGTPRHFAVLIKVRAYVFDGRHELAFGTDVTERVLQAFREADIQTAGHLESTPRRPRPAVSA